VLLEPLSNEVGVSGNEGAIRKIIIPAIKDYVDEVSVDTIGNVYTRKAAKNGSAGANLTVMIAAHMDEIGFMITEIMRDGMLRFTTVGGFDLRILPGKTVLVGKDKIPGVIGTEAIHNLEAGQYDKAPGLKALAIDIGANKKEEAQAKVSLGDYATFDTRYGHLNSDSDNNEVGIIKGKALDDRAGCTMLIELLKQDHPVDVVGVFTVQEEIGLRGARVAAHKTDPDLAIVLECTTANDLPLEKDEEILYPRLGNGPCVTVMDRSFITNQKLLRLIEAAATKNNIPYQYKPPGLGGTDAGAIHQSRMGVPSATIAAPGRYIHGPVALMDLTDFWNCVKLVGTTLDELPEAWT
jgi:putative aminopeptidase FrvX